MQDQITQGTIINGIRSERYPNIPCYGVIISARCDIANCKIPKIHLLSALSVGQWIEEVGIRLAFEEILKIKRNELKKWAENHNINFSILDSFSIQEINKNIAVAEKKSRQDAIQNKWIEYLNLKELLSEQLIPFEHPSYKDAQKKAKDKFKDILNEKNVHYCFVPAAAYCKTEQKGGGIVVDLLDLYQYPLGLMEKLQKNELDVMVLQPDECAALNEKVFLEQPDDFVTIIAQIKSPWIEWLMQRFSFSFIRIGVDKPSDEDIDRIFMFGEGS